MFNQQQQQKDLMTIFLNQSFDSLILQPLTFGSTVVIHIDTYLDLLLVVVVVSVGSGIKDNVSFSEIFFKYIFFH